jgi:hypothetical protein
VDVVVTGEVTDVFLMPLLVGDKKLKTKAATMPRPATTARILRRADHRVSDDLSSGGGGGGSAEGGGPYRGIRRAP